MLAAGLFRITSQSPGSAPGTPPHWPGCSWRRCGSAPRPAWSKLGAVARNGTKIGANASPDANRTLAALDKRIATMLAEAAELDALEDQHDTRDGQAVPDTLVDPAMRRAQLAAAQERLQAAKARLETTAAARAARFATRAAQVNTARAAKGPPPREVKPRPRDEVPQPGELVP